MTSARIQSRENPVEPKGFGEIVADAKNGIYDFFTKEAPVSPIDGVARKAARHGKVIDTSKETSIGNDFSFAAKNKMADGMGMSLMQKARFGAGYMTGNFNSYSGVLKEIPANKILDGVAAGIPKLAGVVEKIQATPELAESFKTALVNDPTFLEGLQKDAANMGTAGTGMLSKIEEALDVPAFRKALTIGLDNLGTQDKVKYKHLNEFTNSLSEFDMDDMEGSKLRVKKGMMGMGIEAETADKLISQGQTQFVTGQFMSNPIESMKNFGDYMSKNMDGLGGWLGGAMAGIAPFLEQVMETLGPIIQQITNGFQGMFDKVKTGLGLDNFEKTNVASGYTNG